LSSFLFILVAGVLSRLLDRAKACGMFEGFVIGRDNVLVSHLQFVDDTLFFASGSDQNFVTIQSILSIFGLVFGLKVNMGKSSLAGINCSQDKLDRLVGFLGCSVDGWPMKVLGFAIRG